MGRNPARRWCQRSAVEWQTLLAQFSASGLTASAYYPREAINEGRLYRWRAQLASFPAAKPPHPNRRPYRLSISAR